MKNLKWNLLKGEWEKKDRMLETVFALGVSLAGAVIAVLFFDMLQRELHIQLGRKYHIHLPLY